MNKLFIVGTFDTKRDELLYAKQVAEEAGAATVTVDVGTREASTGADIPAATVAACHPNGAGSVLGLSDRGAAVTAMATALSAFLAKQKEIGGVLGLGGSGNTALVTEAMRSLPIGVPKLMLSTVASGNTAPYMGPNDIAMMYSVVDIAGLNAISRTVIANAANAAAGMAVNQRERSGSSRPALGMTMFGVTTDCVRQLRAVLEQNYDICVFHATGVGGQSMEKLADSGYFSGLLDITTTEIPDLLFGGVFAATEDRFGAAIRTGLPYLGSVGACDMVNFAARDTVPGKFEDRNLYVHNANVTLMRTTVEENREIGRFIVSRLNSMDGPVRFLLPTRGVSALDAPDMPFHDPLADAALFEEIRAGWREAPNRRLVEVDAHINDPAFADAVIENFNSIIA